MLALAFASLICAMASALADDHNHQGNWNNGRGNGGYNGNGHNGGYNGDWHNGRGNGGYNNGWHGKHGERYGYGPPYYGQSNIYAPPPVYRAPAQSPGINLVFPIHIP